MEAAYPTLQPYPNMFTFPQKPARMQVKADRDINMLYMCLFGAIALIFLSTLYMILFSKYIIEKRTHSVVPGYLEAIIYVALLFNLVYAVGIYYLCAVDESVYRNFEMPVLYASIAYLVFHVALPILGLFISLADNRYNGLFEFLLIPDIFQIGVFGACAYGFYKLYKKTAYLLIPMEDVEKKVPAKTQGV